jgi:hypothetical protein
MIMRMATRTVYYPIAKRRVPDFIRGSGRVRYIRGFLLLKFKEMEMRI